MLKIRTALPGALLLATGVLLAGCGQRGPLYLPKDPAAAQRASLPETLNPTTPRKTAPPSPSAAQP